MIRPLNFSGELRFVPKNRDKEILMNGDGRIAVALVELSDIFREFLDSFTNCLRRLCAIKDANPP